jgi:hypothetical protein
MESMDTVAAELIIQACSAAWQKLEIVPGHPRSASAQECCERLAGRGSHKEKK